MPNHLLWKMTLNTFFTLYQIQYGIWLLKVSNINNVGTWGEGITDLLLLIWTWVALCIYLYILSLYMHAHMYLYMYICIHKEILHSKFILQCKVTDLWNLLFETYNCVFCSINLCCGFEKAMKIPFRIKTSETLWALKTVSLPHICQ